MEYQTLPGSALDKDLGVIASQRRRLVLRFLNQESTDTASIDDIGDYVLQHSSVDEATDPERILTELYHQDLPKLEARGLVEYDLRSGDIRYHPNERIETILKFVTGRGG